MGHSIGDGIIVTAVAFGFVAYWYFRHQERRRRMEIIHQERLVAMEKGLPLPELPLDPHTVPKPPDPRAPLMHGVVWTALSLGAMAALLVMGRFVPSGSVMGEVSLRMWPLPLPLAFLGVGLILYYALVTRHQR